MKPDYFSVLDIFVAFIWFLILSIIISSKSSKIENLNIKRYYALNFYVKVSSALLFTLFYIYYYGGGDTTAYWDGAVVLNKLFFKSPGLYFEALFNPPTLENRLIFFDIETGFPPGWIYREKEAWFVSKLASIISLVTFRSFFATVIVISYFVSIATWKIFELVTTLNLHSYKVAARCMLFVPSVSFWCSGISKDTIIYISMLNILFIVLSILLLKNKIGLSQIFIFLFFIYIMNEIRSFALAATLVPLLVSFGTRLTNRYNSNLFAKFIIRTLILGVASIGFVAVFSSSFVSQLAQEASIIQDDFKNNPTYSGKKYDIGVVDGTPAGMIRAFPISVFYGIYKPFIYEALSPTLILNGIESTILILMTLNFLFVGNVFKKIKRVRSNEFLVFAFVFVLLIGFMAGYTSVLYGVLVRIRAPLLPFLFLIFTTKPEEIIKEDPQLQNNKS